MKKVYILFYFLIIGLIIKANPIALPSIWISELYFDESNNWKLELIYSEINQAEFPIDSIVIYSATDTVKLPNYEFLDSYGVFVITSDSLDSDFTINRYADNIKVVTYVFEEQLESSLIFGDIPGSSINYPRDGQSISYHWTSYSKDNSPTIGTENDTIGMCGTVRGIVYDKYSVPVINRNFKLDYFFETSENGEYSTRVLSKPSIFNNIYHKTGQYSTQSVPITEISYIMEPDSVVELDIYLLGDLTIGTNDINIANTPISVYPNPIPKNGILNISIDLPVITSEIFIEIIDINGKMIMKKRIYQNSTSIIAPGKSGCYIVRTMLDSQTISSNRIIVNE